MKVFKSNQRGMVIWLTGLSGAGKSTLAYALEIKLSELGCLVQVLDGDVLRNGINKNLGFSEEDRLENVRRTAEIAKLFAQSGFITICSLISPMASMRKLASDIIGEHDFVEVYVNASLETCERRDVKGLYHKARKGLITGFTGVSAPYEIPVSPALILDTETTGVTDLVDVLVEKIHSKK